MRNLRANWWLYLALAGFLGYLGPFPDRMILLNLFFLVPLVWLLLPKKGKDEARKRDTPEPPLAPVAGGTARVYMRLAASMLLMFVVPRSLAGQVRQYVGDRRAAPRAVDKPESYEQKVSYTLPFRGEWYVFNGGPDRATSHSWDIVAQRYAYDFVIADDALRSWREETRGTELEDYLCYAEPILSPAEGTIVEVRNDVRDAPNPGTGWMDPFAADIRGNYVVIEHAEGEYSVLGHLIPGSLTVREGEGVARGKELGLCGNAGNSSEPHLHFQVQDRQDFFTAAGLPVSFDGVSVDGAQPESERYLERGERVSGSAVQAQA